MGFDKAVKLILWAYGILMATTYGLGFIYKKMITL